MDALLDWHVATVLVAVVLTLAAFWIYNQNGSKISTGTWIILAGGDSLDLASYFVMTESWWKNAVPAAFAVASIITFGYALARKRFAWPDLFDWLIVGMDALITVMWWQFTTATEANLLYQATTIVAFIPMYRGLLNGRETESLLPWVLWSLAFLLFIAAVISQLQTWEEAIYPAVGFLTHLMVVVIVLKKGKTRR